jgi:hypothetical protein
VTTGAATALFAMSTSVTRDEAQHWANAAAERGATPAELAEAWAKWDAAEAKLVQTVGGDQ